MTHEPLMHDCAVAGSQAVTELITFLREEEREAFAQEAYRVFRALLDSFQIMKMRWEAAVNPSAN